MARNAELMSDKTLSVLVVDRYKSLWEGQAEFIAVPAIDGSLGILPGRQPALAVLAAGDLEIHVPDSNNVMVHVTGGFISLDQDEVTIVVEKGSLVS